MALSLGALSAFTALAADPTGTITVSVADTAHDKLTTSNTIKVYKLLDAKTAGEGANTSYTYTVPTGVGSFRTQLKNAILLYNEAHPMNPAVSFANPTDPTDAEIIAYLGKLTSDDSEEGTTGTAQAFAKQLWLELNPTTDAPTPTATKAGTESGVSSVSFENMPYGYYLVADTDEAGKLRNLMMVDTLDNNNNGVLTVTIKSTTPTVDKQVLEMSDSAAADTAGTNPKWQETADHDVGDTVYYRVIGSLPSKYADYDSYSYKMSDTLSPALTFTSGDMKVYKVSKDVELPKDGTAITAGTGIVDITSLFTTERSTVSGGEKDGYTLITVSNADLKDDTLNSGKVNYEATDKIVFAYAAVLKDNIAPSQDGYDNGAKITYTSDPTWDGTGDEPTDETPEDKTLVFTYELDVNKVKRAASGNGTEALEKAKFKLQKYNAASTAEDKYETLKFKPGTGDKAGNYYRYQGADSVGVGGVVEELYGETLSKFQFTGLDAGRYRLVEVEAPAGYNKIDPIEFQIVSTLTNTEGSEALTKVEIKGVGAQADTVLSEGDGKTFTVDPNNKTLISTDILNELGNKLPSTGGMGTTLFYWAGGILSFGALVLLVTKKRMSRNQE